MVSELGRSVETVNLWCFIAISKLLFTESLAFTFLKHSFYSIKELLLCHETITFIVLKLRTEYPWVDYQ